MVNVMKTLFVCLIWITIFVLLISILIEFRRLFAHRTTLERVEAIFEIIWECLILGGLLLYVTGSNQFLMMLMFICAIPTMTLWFFISTINVLRKWSEKRNLRG